MACLTRSPQIKEGRRPKFIIFIKSEMKKRDVNIWFLKDQELSGTVLHIKQMGKSRRNGEISGHIQLTRTEAWICRKSEQIHNQGWEESAIKIFPRTKCAGLDNFTAEFHQRNTPDLLKLFKKQLTGRNSFKVFP